MRNKALDALAKMHNNGSSLDEKQNFLTLLQALIDGRIIEKNNASLKEYSYNEESEIPLLDYLKNRHATNDDNLFIDFINKNFSDNLIYDKDIIAKSIANIISQSERNSECREKLQQILDSITKEQFIEILFFDERNSDVSFFAETNYDIIRKNAFSNEYLRDIVVDKIEDVSNIIFQHRDFIKNISLEFINYLESVAPNLYERKLKFYDWSYSDDEHKEKIKKEYEQYFLEMVLNLTNTTSSDYRTLKSVKSIREHIYSNIEPTLGLYFKELIRKELPDYIQNVGDSFPEVSFLNQWWSIEIKDKNVEYLLSRDVYTNNKTKPDIISYYINKLLIDDDKYSHYSIESLFKKIEENPQFKEYLKTRKQDLFNEVLSLCMKNKNIKFSYLDKALIIEPEKDSVIKLNTVSLLYNTDYVNKLTRLVKKYGVEKILGNEESLKTLPEELRKNVSEEDNNNNRNKKNINFNEKDLIRYFKGLDELKKILKENDLFNNEFEKTFNFLEVIKTAKLLRNFSELEKHIENPFNDFLSLEEIKKSIFYIDAEYALNQSNALQNIIIASERKKLSEMMDNSSNNNILIKKSRI